MSKLNMYRVKVYAFVMAKTGTEAERLMVQSVLSMVDPKISSVNVRDGSAKLLKPTVVEHD